MTLIDTNVIIDVITRDPHWSDWALRQLDIAATRGRLLINDVIYAEISVRYAAIEALDRMLEQAALVVVPLPRAALFLAGKVYGRYRAAGSTRTGVLPDFFIGAHAAMSGVKLISRDGNRYRTYFPTIDLVTPNSTAS